MIRLASEVKLLERPRPALLPLPSKRRLVLLTFLLLLQVIFQIPLLLNPPDTSSPAPLINAFVWRWLLTFLPYLLACLVVLVSHPLSGRARFVELGLLLGGALLLRLMLLPISPVLSPDAWRYLWDARVTLLGYSPYVYAPGDPQFSHLRDFIFAHSRYRNVPTLYPPGAQFFFLISYLLAPSNLTVLKAIFVGCDWLTCAILAWLLCRRGQDTGRSLLYAWCPLPIVEFAIQGHVDAPAVLLTVLTLLIADDPTRCGRAMTGFLLGMATLVRLYPALLLLAIARRRDWLLLLVWGMTLVAGYLPYLILGHGQLLSPFESYAGSYTPNAGLPQQLSHWLGLHTPLNPTFLHWLEEGLIGAILGGSMLTVLWMRWRHQLSREAAALLLISALFAASAHIFPWYTPVFIPLAALLLAPRGSSPMLKRSAALCAWYFACATPLAYFFMYERDWTPYYVLVYWLPLTSLGLIAGAAGWQWLRQQRINLNPPV
ncbi:glycosyltransferase 87 family protein [Thermogemmatispora sp.]|uniref:glycosyltransferase 87 family protein n=1 Tax=Thermogemmatispora sp. TaxID=1968838 RepID=UPI001DC69225|nr:glycosyltransferase 87 family protein [Thermogemmatispora sp.]MBX5450083.1 DUF2029 domain-containing protein [Thermogemmatispora sp.]